MRAWILVALMMAGCPSEENQCVFQGKDAFVWCEPERICLDPGAVCPADATTAEQCEAVNTGAYIEGFIWAWNEEDRSCLSVEDT